MWVKLLLYLSLECTGRISCYLLIMVMLWLQVRGGYGRYILYSTRRYYVLSLAKLVATKTTDIIKFYDRCHQRVVTRVSALTFWSLGVAGSSEVSMVCTKILEIPEQLQIPDHQLLFCLAPPPRKFFWTLLIIQGNYAPQFYLLTRACIWIWRRKCAEFVWFHFIFNICPSKSATTRHQPCFII